MRLEALKIIDADAKLVLFKRRSARWGAKSEPGDDTRAPEQPRLLKRTIELLSSSGVMPIESVSSYIGLAANDVEKLAGWLRQVDKRSIAGASHGMNVTHPASFNRLLQAFVAAQG